jgi:hypothetical protein
LGIKLSWISQCQHVRLTMKSSRRSVGVQLG